MNSACVVKNKAMQTQMRGILKEVSAVAIREMKNSNHHNKSLTTVVEESLSVPSLEEFAFQVMSDTRNNVSSMLQDVKAGQMTEVQYLNGHVTSLGQDKYEIDCLNNAEMCRLMGS